MSFSQRADNGHRKESAVQNLRVCKLSPSGWDQDVVSGGHCKMKGSLGLAVGFNMASVLLNHVVKQYTVEHRGNHLICCQRWPKARVNVVPLGTAAIRQRPRALQRWWTSRLKVNYIQWESGRLSTCELSIFLKCISLISLHHWESAASKQLAVRNVAPWVTDLTVARGQAEADS